MSTERFNAKSESIPPEMGVDSRMVGLRTTDSTAGGEPRPAPCLPPPEIPGHVKLSKQITRPRNPCELLAKIVGNTTLNSDAHRLWERKRRVLCARKRGSMWVEREGHSRAAMCVREKMRQRQKSQNFSNLKLIC